MTAASGDQPDDRAAQLRRRSEALFAVLVAEDTPAAARDRARDELVALHLPLAEHCARRYRNRGETWEDLVQVGTVGLLKAIDRFDPSRGIGFSSYATPTIIGELKRHFRDRRWAIRVPRRLQELQASIRVATAELAQELGRSPTPRELADRLGVGVEEILEGLESGAAYRTLSLEYGRRGPSAEINEVLMVDDVDLANVEIRETLRPLLDRLPAREKQILTLRFYKGQSQAQIAQQLGISQMHVSRLLTRTIGELRRGLEG